MRERGRLKERKRVRERERDEESMRIGKERKRAKRDRNSNIFGVVRNSTIGKEMRKKRGVGEEDPRSRKGPETIFHFNKQVDKEIYPLLPLKSLKN